MTRRGRAGLRMSEQAPRPDADALGDICLAAYQLPRQAEYAEDRAEAFDVTDTHEALGAQDHLLFECVFRAKVATDSGRNLPPIPGEGCHSFRLKAAPDSG